MDKRWWQRSQAEEVEPVPWLHPDVVDYLESLLTPEMHVLEHGSGGSTLWFAERVASVTAVESDPKWLSSLSYQIPDNVLLLGPDEEIELEFDLLLIDGEPIETRGDWLRRAGELVVPGGLVVLDNANRPEYRHEVIGLAEWARLLKSFDRNDPETSYLVTDFFRLPDRRENIRRENTRKVEDDPDADS